MSEKEIKLFVYGTLKAGYGLHRIIEDAHYIGEVKTAEQYTLATNGWYPMLMAIEDTPKTNIKGELYVIDRAMLDRCDVAEGQGTLFKREIIDVIDEEGNEHGAWAYFYLNSRSDMKHFGHELLLKGEFV